MTFTELLQQIESRLPGQILDGDAAETLAKARSGRHQHALAGKIIACLFENGGLPDAAAPIIRSQAVSALAPLRLEFMKDDAPVEGFRLIEKVVHAIDGAFNDEALRQKASRLP
ncbi:MAG TPA: hypothetical protein VLT92_13920 [Burkholderiales bacterium]|nr:hypothetical protein [Burkholderiales bacterium]